MRTWKIASVTALTILGMGAGAPRQARPAIHLDKPLHLEGTVARADWVDPVWVELDVTVDGRRERWRVKAGAPNTLFRRGWKRDSLPVGTRVVLNGFLVSAQRKIAWGPGLRLADGGFLWLPHVLNDVDLAGAQEAGVSARSCPSTSIGGLPADIDEARRAGDYRPLSSESFWSRGRNQYPGVSCPAGDEARLRSKGGVFYSDAQTICPAGWDEMKSQIEAMILAYNRELASWPEFQAETGCGLAE